MKTVFTTLPIYKAKRDTCYERGKANGSKKFEPIYCPRHRLPSFQWVDDGDGATVVSEIYFMNINNVLTDITSYFVDLPALYTSDAGDNYFIYNGDTLNYALPVGAYSLKIVMDSGHIYYSDWFLVQCVYCPFTDIFVNNSFDTFDITGNLIGSCIDAGANAYADSSPWQEVYQGQVITIMFYLTTSGATNPRFSIVSDSAGVISNVADAVAGLNELTLTVTSPADDAFVRIQCTGATDFSTSEILVYTQYACGYVTLSFSNCCNLGDLLYENDFMQTLWLNSDNIEEDYPYTEKGQENGEGKFIPTFRRQEKTYTIRMGYIPQFLVDVLHRLQLHDVITYIDQIGDAFNVESVVTENEWQDDLYYAIASIKLNMGEDVITNPCC